MNSVSPQSDHFIYLAIILGAFSLLGPAHGQTDELCRLFKNGTTLRSPNSCNEYIVCDGGIPYTSSCPSGQLFDRNKKTCVNSSTLANDVFCNNRCKGNDNKWIYDPNDCRKFYYCMNDEPVPGTCVDGYYFDEKTQMCVYQKDAKCLGNVGNVCDLVPDGTNFVYEMDCSQHYECDKRSLKLSKCKKQQYYNVETGKCDDIAKVTCSAHPIPDNICSASKKPSPGFKSDGVTCRGYFFCRDLGDVWDREPIWGQCPEGLFFSNGKCSEPIDAYCTYNRCEGRNQTYVSSSSNDCHNYIVCDNGKFVEERSCPGDMFFDEIKQSCTNNIIDYACCDDDKKPKKNLI